MSERGELLATLVERMVTRRGVDYLITSKALRRVLSEITDEEFREGVNLIDDPFKLGQLLSMGLSLERIGIITEWRLATHGKRESVEEKLGQPPSKT